MHQRFYKYILALLTLISSVNIFAEPPRQLTHRDSVFIGQLRRRFDIGAEYMAPYDASRMIRTVSINAYACLQMFERVHLSVGLGLTTTYAWGNIVQYDQHFNNITLQTAAFGIGPGLLIRFEPIIVGRFSVSLDINEAFILYSTHFPAGGDVYNFMNRLGGGICYRVSKRSKVSLYGRWMHVSNGQGLNQHNPSYNSAGAGLSVIHYF